MKRIGTMGPMMSSTTLNLIGLDLGVAFYFRSLLFFSLRSFWLPWQCHNAIMVSQGKCGAVKSIVSSLGRSGFHLTRGRFSAPSRPLAFFRVNPITT